MKQEYKDLLLKELCARIPYGVKVNAPFTSNKNENAKGYKINSINFRVVEWTPVLFGEKKQRNSIIIETFSEKYNQYSSIDLELNNAIDEVKLYLFPLSSMTEEQRENLMNICGERIGFNSGAFIDFNGYGEIPMKSVNDVIDWLNANHFDYRGLIEKELAIDANNLNIY